MVLTQAMHPSPFPATTRPQPGLKTARSAFAVISTVVISTGTVYEVARNEQWQEYVKQRVPFSFESPRQVQYLPTRIDTRSPSEHLSNIKEIFDVSRQSVYKWISSRAKPEESKAKILSDLSRAADCFRDSGIVRAGSLLRMKAFDGKSLADLILAGEDYADHVSILIAESKAVEESYRLSGLPSKTTPPTSEWQSLISIPGSIEI
jgi:hypothetical protein